MLAVYLRYRELLEFRAMTPDCRISKKSNRAAMWLGVTSAMGLCMVANFQVMKVPLPHYIGAFFCFVGGSVYFGLQVGTAERVTRRWENRRRGREWSPES